MTKCSTCVVKNGKNLKCSICLLGIEIRCGVTCGCGNVMVEYNNIIEEGVVLLTCSPFSAKYEHPQLIRVKL